MASISSRINSVLSRKDLQNVEFGVEVVEAKTGKIVFRKNHDKPLIPASNMKIISSAVALEVLGADYEFKTCLAMLGKTLVVIGGGDPLLCDEETDEKYDRDKNWLFKDIIATLKAKDIKSVNGIIIDSTFFDDKRVHPSWDRNDLNKHYACEVSGLNFNRNCISINVKRIGSAVRVTTEPNTSYLRIINQVKTRSSGNSAVGAYRNKTPNKVTLKGYCRTATGFDVAIENPALYFGTVLSEHLKSAGIGVTGRVKEKYVKNDPKIKVLKVYKTPIKDVLARCNKDSFNLAAESLIKTVSAEHTAGRINGEWKHGFVLAGRYLDHLKVTKDQYNFDDGCGLSRNNRVSPDVMVKILACLYHGENRETFVDSLSIGGVDGTSSKYFSEPEYKGRIFAKTGYISGVRAFSGYVTTDHGDYIFSILTEGGGSYVRGAINQVVKSIF